MRYVCIEDVLARVILRKRLRYMYCQLGAVGVKSSTVWPFALKRRLSTLGSSPVQFSPVNSYVLWGLDSPIGKVLLCIVAQASALVEPAARSQAPKHEQIRDMYRSACTPCDSYTP